jgi:hypothetical protein
MYICDICGNTFEKPDKQGGFSDRHGLEEEYYCPCCGSNAVEEAVTCEACENVFTEDQVKFINVTNKYSENIQGYICEDCLYQAIEEIMQRSF